MSLMGVFKFSGVFPSYPPTLEIYEVIGDESRVMRRCLFDVPLRLLRRLQPAVN